MGSISIDNITKKTARKSRANIMSEQNNTSFAHAFLPGLILGLIIGAVAGAFVPDMMSANKIKVDPAHAGGPSHRDMDQMDDMIDDAAQTADDAIDNMEDTAEDLVDDAEAAAEDLIDDAEENLPDSP